MQTTESKRGSKPRHEPTAVQELLTRGEIVLVDVSPAEEFEVQHIPGSINIPIDQLEELAPELIADRSTPVVTLAADGDSPYAMMGLSGFWALGYTSFAYMSGGKAAWIDAGLPVASLVA